LISPAARLCLGALAGGISVAAFLIVPLSASAAHPCGSEDVGEKRPARVATVRVGCETGLQVAKTVYEEIRAHEGEARVHFRVEGFRCSAVLAETEISCRRGDEWVFASTQPTDHPGEWHVPHESHKRPYWRHCAPVKEVVNGDMLTHRVTCAKGRKVIRRVLRKSQTAQSSHIHVMGYSCGLRPYATRPITCHKSGHRILSPLAG
jgi:hypothetical protein